MHYGSEKLLRKYLLESGEITQGQYDRFSDSAKSASVAFVAGEIMSSLKDKMPAVDSQEIDRSRGDLKQYKEYPAIQSALSKLKSSIDGVADYFGQGEAANAVADIIECLGNISKHSADFKEAYRDKKTIVIVQYEAIVLAVIQSISYLIATCTEAAKGDDSPVEYPEIKHNKQLKAIRDFNDSCRTGSFDAALKDANFIRENYVEHGLEVLSSISESSGVYSTVVDGFNNFVDSINGGNRKLTDALYKSAAAISMLAAARDSVYAIAKMKSSISDAIGNIKSYIDGFAGSALSRIKAYNSRLPQEVAYASDQADKEIEAQDREIKDVIKSMPERDYSAPQPEAAASQPKAPAANPQPAAQASSGPLMF